MTVMKRQKRMDVFWKQIFYPRMILTAHELRATVISRIGMFTLTMSMCENVIYCIPVKLKKRGGGLPFKLLPFTNNISIFCSSVQDRKYEVLLNQGHSHIIVKYQFFIVWMVFFFGFHSDKSWVVEVSWSKWDRHHYIWWKYLLCLILLHLFIPF